MSNLNKSPISVDSQQLAVFADKNSAMWHFETNAGILAIEVNRISKTWTYTVLGEDPELDFEDREITRRYAAKLVGGKIPALYS